MTHAPIRRMASVLSLTAALSGPAMAQEVFTLTSPVMADGGTLPADLKCERDGGDGLSPPINWTSPPEGTKGYAIIITTIRAAGSRGWMRPATTGCCGTFRPRP